MCLCSQGLALRLRLQNDDTRARCGHVTVSTTFDGLHKQQQQQLHAHSS